MAGKQWRSFTLGWSRVWVLCFWFQDSDDENALLVQHECSLRFILWWQCHGHGGRAFWGLHNISLAEQVEKSEKTKKKRRKLSFALSNVFVTLGNEEDVWKLYLGRSIKLGIVGKRDWSDTTREDEQLLFVGFNWYSVQSKDERGKFSSIAPWSLPETLEISRK